jgi:DNA processing protein
MNRRIWIFTALWRSAPADLRRVAVPGAMRKPLRRGGRDLIRGGANLAAITADISNERGLALPPNIQAGMDKEHKILLDALGFDPADRDVWWFVPDLKAEAVSSMRLILELEGPRSGRPRGPLLPCR